MGLITHVLIALYCHNHYILLCAHHLITISISTLIITLSPPCPTLLSLYRSYLFLRVQMISFTLNSNKLTQHIPTSQSLSEMAGQPMLPPPYLHPPHPGASPHRLVLQVEASPQAPTPLAVVSVVVVVLVIVRTTLPHPLCSLRFIIMPTP